MYTEKSAELKTDFYVRYGETAGHIIFEKTGIPCILMESDERCLAFAFDCGIRAYGRKYGDVLKVMNSRSNICDVRFVDGGRGAQILYTADDESIRYTDEAIRYTVMKILRRLQCTSGKPISGGMAEICDIYGRGGWCAYINMERADSVPLPLIDYNVMLIRTRNKRLKLKHDNLSEIFNRSETERIDAAAEGLKKCRMDVLFDMINESTKSQRMMLNLPWDITETIDIAYSAEGVAAVKICSQGVICFTEKSYTDTAAAAVSYEFEKNIGYSAGIVVVK